MADLFATRIVMSQLGGNNMADMFIFRMDSEGAGWVNFSDATPEEILGLEIGLYNEMGKNAN